MPYDKDKIPAEAAPAIPAQPGEYIFTVDITGNLPDGSPRATIDDLDMFDAEAKVGNRQMLDFLDRVVTKVVFRGEALVTRKTVKEPYEEDGKTKERERVEESVEGVRGKNIPYGAIKRIFEAVGAAMKEANNAGN